MDDSAHTGPMTVTALFDRREAAEAAAERIRDLGVTEESVRIRAGAGDHAWNLEHGAIPEEDRREYDAALADGMSLVVASFVPHGLHAEAVAILERTDATEERSPDEAPDGPGAVGTLGGAGRATGTTDRLTGEPIGDAGAEISDDPENDRGWGGGGTATGVRDRLTGERIGARRDIPRVRSYPAPGDPPA